MQVSVVFACCLHSGEKGCQFLYWDSRLLIVRNATSTLLCFLLEVQLIFIIHSLGFTECFHNQEFLLNGPRNHWLTKHFHSATQIGNKSVSMLKRMKIHIITVLAELREMQITGNSCLYQFH